MPVSQDDFGKKGWRGAGETRVAIEEWYQVRAIDTWSALKEFFFLFFYFCWLVA